MADGCKKLSGFEYRKRALDKLKVEKGTRDEKMMEQNSSSDHLKLLHVNDMYTEFPNVEIAYRIFMTLTVTNCSAKRSFSYLKKVKNFSRSTMTANSANRLNSLAILCIKSDVR